MITTYPTTAYLFISINKSGYDVLQRNRARVYSINWTKRIRSLNYMHLPTCSYTVVLPLIGNH